jgi:hypothetical protein
MNNVKRAKGQPTTDVETQNITPEPGWVTAAAHHASKLAPHTEHSSTISGPALAASPVEDGAISKQQWLLCSRQEGRPCHRMPLATAQEDHSKHFVTSV